MPRILAGTNGHAVRRDLRRLAGTQFDVLVVGAGIYGAAIAWEAAHRGLLVGLMDRGDFGGGTSFNSLKVVHGGLRSLQRGSLAEMRQFIRDRRALLRIAPHLVEPIRFVVPTYPEWKRSRPVMRVALALNDLVARDRNRGVDPARWLGPSRLLSTDETIRAFPGLDARRITGGASWHDARMYSADRLLLAFVRSAAERDACPANYVAAVGLLTEGSRVLGVRARDEVTGDTFPVRAAVTVNATGAWAPALLPRHLPPIRGVHVRMSKAMNLVTRLPAPACALGNVVDGRFVFSVPWRGIAMFGTLHVPHDGTPDGVRVTRDEIAAFLHDINRAFPQFDADIEDVTLVHEGLLPMAGVRNGEVVLERHSRVHVHTTDGLEGLVTVVGVRYTTARDTAVRVVDTLGPILRRTLPRSASATAPLAGGAIGDVALFLRAAGGDDGVRPAMAPRLARLYGTHDRDVLALADRDQAMAGPLGAECVVTGAEILYAVQEEMALRLGDAVLRRTEAGSAAQPNPAALHRAAAIMARELGWSATTVAAEIAAVEARYRIPG